MHSKDQGWNFIKINFTFWNEALTGINLSELRNITSAFKNYFWILYLQEKQKEINRKTWVWGNIKWEIQFLKINICFKGFKKDNKYDWFNGYMLNLITWD